MTHLRILLARLFAMFRKSKLERELDAEIRGHLEMQADDNVRAGMDRNQAMQSALRSFGGVDVAKERYRDLRGLRIIETLFHDVRYSVRALLQSRGFALTAITSIALGIGANSAIFSVADGLLLRPLPVANASEVMALRSVAPTANLIQTGNVSYMDYQDFRKNIQSFEDLVIFDDIGGGFARSAEDQPFVTGGYLVSGNFFDVLEINLPLGRGFTPQEDEVPGRDAVIVLAHDLWKSQFGADASVIGRRVRLNGLDFTVIGVAPESFTGINQFLKPGYFVPVMMGTKIFTAGGVTLASDLLTGRGERHFSVRGRLRPNVSMSTATIEVARVAKSLESAYPDTNRGFGAVVQTEAQNRMATFPGLGALVTAMMVVVTVVLLIACANVANLMLTRGRTRQREIAVRLALGASRLRLVRLLLIESLVIAAAGGALAWFLANVALRILTAMEPPATSDVPPFYIAVQLDERVLWFTILVSIASAFIFGLAPALESVKTDLVSALKVGHGDSGRKRLYGRNLLVITQIAGSMLLLVSVTQFRHAFDEALAGNPGFAREHRITMRFDPGLAGYTAPQIQQFYDRVLRQSLQVPGVRSAAWTSVLPMTYLDMGLHSVIPEGYDFAPGTESVQLLSYVVDHGYFDTLDIPVIAGRGFRADDRPDSPKIAIVNEAFAKEYLGENPIGKRVWLNNRNAPPVEVVGVTVTGKTISIIEPPVQVIYLPMTQNPMTRMTLVAETTGDPKALVTPLREVIRSSDPKVPVFWVRTMEDVFETSLVGALRVVEVIYTSASLMGLLLALIGLYAVVSYQAAQRTYEIGIRMALGAERLQVLRMFLVRAGVMGVAGVSIGVVLSFLFSGFARENFGAPRFDTLLLLLVVLGMLLTTLLAAAIPARRASRIDPQRALRQE